MMCGRVQPPVPGRSRVAPVPTLLVIGPVGVGKTTVAGEVAYLLRAAGEPYAFVDVDALRWSYLSPPADPYRSRLALANLAAIWPNFRAEGARRLVLADVVERRDDLADYARAVPGAEIVVVRLRASRDTLACRLRRGMLGSGLEWHLHRAPELAALMDARRVEDHLVETDGRGVGDVARDVLTRVGWPTPPPER